MHTENSHAPKKLIGVPAAADMLGIAKRTVYVLVAAGELQSCRIGRRVLIPTDGLEAFIRSHLAGAKGGIE